ncbi:multidrug transporter [Klebsiella pneumoniae]|nr:multidrug transporter [Klebsiella pneumoniae]
MPHFFIERPIFAWVIPLFIVLTGLLSHTSFTGCAIP